MKRTIKSLGVALAPAALIPLMVACQKQPQTPAGTTPTTEPGAPSMQQQPAQPPPGAEMPKPIAPGPTSERGTREQGAGGFDTQPGREAQPPMHPGEQPGLGSGLGQQGQAGEQPSQGETGTPSSVNEHALCESLAQTSRLRVEDVPGGVAIVATPKAGHDLSTVREEARRLENSIRAGGAEGQGGAQRGVKSSEACGIAELGRLPSVSVQLTEGGNAVRILMTTNNTAEVRDLRRIARDEVNALTRSVTPGRQQQPGQRQPGSRGQHPGTQQHPGGAQQPPGQQQQPGQQQPGQQQPPQAPEKQP